MRLHEVQGHEWPHISITGLCPSEQSFSKSWKDSSYFSSVQIEILRKPDLNLRSSQPITGLSRPALCSCSWKPITVLILPPCSSHEEAWESPPGQSHTSHESWNKRTHVGDKLYVHVLDNWHFLTHLRLYQASSLSRMSRKFLSSGRLNCSHWISPGSFSWRKYFSSSCKWLRKG